MFFNASKLIRFFVIAGICLISPAFVRAETTERTVTKVTKPQPLYVGARIFTKSDPVAGHQAYYSYVGYEAGALTIRYDLYYHFDELEESEVLTVPVGSENKAIVATRPFQAETAGTASKLKLTVVDSQGGITVEEMR